jgi:hypothetical protein
VPIAKDYVKFNSYANLGEVVNAKLWFIFKYYDTYVSIDSWYLI